MDERRAAKQAVLTKVNQVLVNAGLNDTVWSIRDCDSTLFVLMHKKLVGKLPGIVPSPTSGAEHSSNFQIVLDAIASDEHVQAKGLEAQVRAMRPQALADGELEALNDFAGIFSVLCDAILQHGQDARASEASSSAMPVPGRAPPARPASAVPATKCAHTYADVRPSSARATSDSLDRPLQPLAADRAPSGAAATSTDAMPLSPTGPRSAAATTADMQHDGGAYAACAAACVQAISSAASANAAVRNAPSKKATPRDGSSAKGRMKTRIKAPTSAMHLQAISHALAQRRGARPRSAPPAKTSGKAVGSGPSDGDTTSALAREIAVLQANIRGRQYEGNASSRLARVMNDEFGARAASAYAALVKQSIAGVRRAETLEVTRGIAADRNARRDAKIAALREQRIGSETVRAEAARIARRAAKEELGYRHLYSHALSLERERLLLEASTSEEARRKTLEGRRQRQAALEQFHVDQLSLLQEQLATEARERAFRERVQLQMASKLEVESRAKQAAALQALKDQLDHNEKMDYGVPLSTSVLVD